MTPVRPLTQAEYLDAKALGLAMARCPTCLALSATRGFLAHYDGCPEGPTRDVGAVACVTCGGVGATAREVLHCRGCSRQEYQLNSGTLKGLRISNMGTCEHGRVPQHCPQCPTTWPAREPGIRSPIVVELEREMAAFQRSVAGFDMAKQWRADADAIYDAGAARGDLAGLMAKHQAELAELTADRDFWQRECARTPDGKRLVEARGKR